MSLSVDSLPPNTLPTVLACETLADGVRLQLWLDPDLPWFTGHFPGAPLLPGVTQIHWVMHYAASLPAFAQRLMAAFWPGPLTLIVPRRNGVAQAAAGGQNSVGPSF